MYFNERECIKAMVDADVRSWNALVEKTGMCRKTLYNIRVGNTIPTIDQCYTLKKALKLDTHRFFKVFPEDD